MKHIEVNINDVRDNLKSNRKIMVIILFIFVTIGLSVGIFDGRLYKKTCTIERTEINQIQLEKWDRDETFYYHVFLEVKEKDCELNAYVQYLKQVKLSGESLEKVSNFEEKLTLYDKSVYNDLKNYFYAIGPIILNEDTESFIKNQIEISKEKVMISNQVIEELEGSLTQYFDSREKERALNQKVYAENEVRYWNEQLEKIDRIDISELEKNNEKMDILLEKASYNLNELIQEFNMLIQDIENREQYEIIYNRYLLNQNILEAGMMGELDEEDIVNVRKEEALIYARSIAGVDVPEERFWAIMTFFCIFGATLSMLYGSIRKNNV